MVLTDLGDNYVDFAHGKGGDVRNPCFNLFENPGFRGAPRGQDAPVPGWIISHGSSFAQVLPPEILPDHNVLSLRGVGDVQPISRPQVRQGGRYLTCSFGAFVKTTTPNAVRAVLSFSNGGTQTSAPHPGDGEWHFIGMVADVKEGATFVIPKFEVSVETQVSVTTPSFCFGNETMPTLESPLSSVGGTVYGTFTTGLGRIDRTTSSNPYIQVPMDGNVFFVEGSHSISRINPVQNRFPRGTVITLLFNDRDLVVTHNPFIGLRDEKDFVSRVNSSLTLISLGVGTWRELSRNEAPNRNGSID